jgi:hypothetical protein
MISLFGLAPSGTSTASHTPGAPRFEPTAGFKLCNDLRANFVGPAPLQGGGGACAENDTQAAKPDLTLDFDLPRGHLNVAAEAFVFTLSGEFAIAADSEIPDATLVGGASAQAELGLLNGPCNSTVQSEFILYEATTDIDESIDVAPHAVAILIEDGTDTYEGKGDSSSPLVSRYPGFNNRFFDPDGTGDWTAGYSPVPPHSRYVGATKIQDEWQLLQVFVFQPGALKAAFDANPANSTHPFSRLHSTLGWTMVLLLNDSAGYSSFPSAVNDWCSSLSLTGMLLGRVDVDGNGVPDTDRLTSPATAGGIDGEGTHLAQLYTLSIRDADGDGIDNSLDTCPYVANQEDPWSTNAPDYDGLDSACDPSPTVASPPATPPDYVDNDSDTLVDEDPVNGYDDDGDTAVDEDGNCRATAGLPDQDQDCYPDRQDNCPLVSNPGQTEGELSQPRNSAAPDGGPRNDHIGNSCDSQPTVANGRFFHAFDSDAFCINDTPGADGDGDGWCHITAGADPNDNAPNITGRKNQNADGYLFPGQPGHGHPNYTEVWMQTDPLADCPEVIGKHDAWPPDFTKNRQVNSGDTIAGFGQGQMLTQEGDPNYRRRSDADANRQVNVGDLLLLLGGGVMLTACTPP